MVTQEKYTQFKLLGNICAQNRELNPETFQSQCTILLVNVLQPFMNANRRDAYYITAKFVSIYLVSVVIRFHNTKLRPPAMLIYF